MCEGNELGETIIESMKRHGGKNMNSEKLLCKDVYFCIGNHNIQLSIEGNSFSFTFFQDEIRLPSLAGNPTTSAHLVIHTHLHTETSNN